MECVVLEATDSVGGRVSTQAAPGFAAPLDLGASIITGEDPCQCRCCSSGSTHISRLRARNLKVSKLSGLLDVCYQSKHRLAAEAVCRL